MFGIINYPLFIITGIGLNLYPGNDTMYIIARSMSQGRRAGIISVLGISSGGIFHTLCAACGLSQILMTSAALFTTVKYLGGLYLIYLGVKMLIQKEGAPGFYSGQLSSGKIYRQGVITNILNPKVALFFLSFLPQFIDHSSRHTFVPFLVLGVTFITTGTVWCIIVALFSSQFARLFHKDKKSQNILQKAAAALYILLGLKFIVKE